MSIATFPLQHSADDLLVINIHGLNATKTQSFKEQILSTTTLLKNHVGPIIFAGDFNTRNKKRTQFLKSFMRHYGLREVHWDKDYRMKFANYPLDHVFVKKLHIKKSVVRNDIDTSDHKALEVHLALE